jgi:uncharacterized protein YuzE
MRFTFDPEVDMALLHLGVPGQGRILTSFCKTKDGELGIKLDEIGHVVGFSFNPASRMLAAPILDDPEHVHTRLKPEEVERERHERSRDTTPRERTGPIRFAFDPEVNMASIHLGVRGEGTILTSFCNDVPSLGIDVDALGYVIGFEFQAAAQRLPAELLDDPANIRTRLSQEGIQRERRERHGKLG